MLQKLILLFFLGMFIPSFLLAQNYEDLSELQYFDYAPHLQKNIPSRPPSQKKTEEPLKVDPLVNPNHNLVFNPTIGGATGFFTVPVAYINEGLSFTQNTEGTFFAEKTDVSISLSANYGYKFVEIFLAYHQLDVNQFNRNVANIGFKVRLFATESPLFSSAIVVNFYPYFGKEMTPSLEPENPKGSTIRATTSGGGLAVQTLFALSSQIYGLTISGVFGKSFGTNEDNSNWGKFDFGGALSLRIIDSKYFSLSIVGEIANYDARGLSLYKNDKLNLNAFVQLGFIWNLASIQIGVSRLLNTSPNIFFQPGISLYF